MKITIIAVADIHSPHYLPLFNASINGLLNREADVIILAGDIVDGGDVTMVRPVINTLNRLIGKMGLRIPIVSVFGNEEYMGLEEKFRSMYPEIIWLDDNYVTLSIKNKNICIVGSRGVLRKPTSWQRRNIPNIEHIYETRLNKIKNSIKECNKQYLTILVTHYAPTYLTLYGENPAIYNYLGYPIIEKLPTEMRPRIALHGHAHNASKLYANVNSVDVYNVSLVARKGLTIINIHTL